MRNVSVLALLLLFGCQQKSEYSGDGVLIYSEGLLLNSYNLELPEFDLDNNKHYEYKIRSLYTKNRTSFVSLIVNSDEKTNFEKLSTNVSVEIVDEKTGFVVFKKKSDLNEHLLRMQREQVVSYPNDNEWLAHYKYANKYVENKIVPFSIGASPIRQLSIEYRAIKGIDMSNSQNYRVLIAVTNVDKEFVKLTAKLKISGGWK